MQRRVDLKYEKAVKATLEFISKRGDTQTRKSK